jgi:hypothetical protein
MKMPIHGVSTTPLKNLEKGGEGGYPGSPPEITWGAPAFEITLGPVRQAGCAPIGNRSDPVLSALT